MSAELRVLNGSRAGAKLSFDKDEISIGRHAMSDLRFDPQAELDVSTRHAEISKRGTAWFIIDAGSTNGTLVNGQRIAAEHQLADGDVISFGANGPRAEFRTDDIAAPATRLQRESKPAAAAPKRQDTTVRVAAEVRAQTKSMQRNFAVALVLVVAAAGGLFAWSQRRNSEHDAELNALISRGDSSLAAYSKIIGSMRPNDSAVTRELTEEFLRKKTQMDSMRAMSQRGSASKANVDEMRRQMAQSPTIGQIDIPRVSDANDAAVAFVVSDLEGSPIGGTAFGISPNGMLVTNKHVVLGEGGKPARRIAILYANTNKWMTAKLVRTSDTDDLALVQVDNGAGLPVVSGVSRDGGASRVGSQVVTIGYPLANDTPMEGEGINNMTARTTTTPGTVSKRLDNVLQIDSFSAHGASGSPLFDANGVVVGVIYGGARESAGRIVYAVPSQRLAAFLGADAGSIIR